MKNKLSVLLAVVAGLLLLASGISGLATWELISALVTKFLVDNIYVHIAFAVIMFIASLGGLSVIMGGLLIGKGRAGTGKLFIALGAGMGLLGLLFSAGLSFLSGEFALKEFLSAGTLGVILSIAARMAAKQKPKSKLIKNTPHPS